MTSPSTSPRRPPAPGQAGFTLVELLVVLAIIGLLATIVVVNVLPAQSGAKVKKAQADLALIEQGLELWRLEMGRYPDAAEGLKALTVPGAMGPALKRLPDDPWGRPYNYRIPGEDGRPYDLWSWGSDGEPGGEGDAADITNWR
ncbi:MAG: type II secretion system major pseudopilin GspG [Sphingomonadaceae bacterium]|uniref:type II secretion system major pseudopilin GspG n=1 Tax=Thermaurantiacus sp. TaxID=2820283 RepID=UPI00298F34F8|nr:type II secretion system major pseudopilin GspG [Thermaurantiacus sp.]MCS6987418.1 type II secretion system major pseudopilin GspG [Sphingomonadaceae bacterium]MDW8415338.1 type II secretion system major pseudopilin GspG [Thermaurantiacus sp.]